ncbi:DUF4012 domain-containing protein [Cellulosimicrobium arenosum]|uniref:DUF4012 domain-containing protein n=1 Tax=Cellulosimicrobium arenosum TaxID=2708133 RepID=A0A927J0T0_9MICO|nr:DUF4012 domain-containing protein [Cellulosimicrobium arenosum]MBD8079794.1 DUF4012 domain-containing protein [Cellulosimicrobium arenosum]
MSTTTSGTGRARRRHRWVGWTVLALVVAALVAVGLFARDALTARAALTEALTEVPAAQDAASTGDLETATAVLDRVQGHTATARSSTDGPLWALAAHAPLVGADVHAVAVASATADDLAAVVLPSLAEVAGVVGGGALTLTPDGVDLAPLEDAAPVMADAASTFDAIDARLATVEPADLHAETAAPFAQLVAATDELRPTVRTADRVTSLGPVMLGADGPRRYLVLAQNNAELRATGGIPGALALVTVDDGKVTLERQVPTGEIPIFDAPVLPLDPGVEQLYTDRVGRFLQDTTLTPDFPTAAALTAEMWLRSQDEAVDGVVATDPVALSYLLEATGPIEVDGRTVDSENVVRTLLSDVYADYGGGDASDAFFAAVSAQVMSTFLAGDVDLGVASDALVRSADEHRLLVWSAHPDEQERLTGTVVAGDIETADRARDSIGVFFNDGTGGKMSYYLDHEITLTESTCTAAGRVDTFTVALASTAPDDAADLPWYVTGGGADRVAPGVTRTFVVLYAPHGGWLTDIQVGEEPAPAQPAMIAGRAARSVMQDLAPGESVALTFSTVTPARTSPVLGTGDGQVDVWSTPTARAGGLRTLDVAPCG